MGKNGVGQPKQLIFGICYSLKWDWTWWWWCTTSEKATYTDNQFNLELLISLRAADWKLDAPDWTGRLRVVAKGKDIFIKLEDKMSGKAFVFKYGKDPIEHFQE